MTGYFVIFIFTVYLLFFFAAFVYELFAVEMKGRFKVVFIEKRYKPNVIFKTVVKAEGENPFYSARIYMKL